MSFLGVIQSMLYSHRSSQSLKCESSNKRYSNLTINFCHAIACINHRQSLPHLALRANHL